MPDQTDTADRNADTQNDELLYTNPLLSHDLPVDNVRAVLALLTHLDLSESTLGSEGNHGLVLVHEWLRRSMAYSGHENELTIPISNA